MTSEEGINFDESIFLLQQRAQVIEKAELVPDGAQNLMQESETIIAGECGAFLRPKTFFEPPPLELCGRNYQELANSDLSLRKVLVSNLGGYGPSMGDEVIRYGEAKVIGDQQIDLIVSSVGDYKPYEALRNGLRGRYGQINMGEGSGKFKFSLVDSKTDEPFKLKHLAFSVLDLNQEAACKARSKVTARGFSAYYLSHDSEVQVVPNLPDGATAFMSTGSGHPETWQSQNGKVGAEARAVTFVFDDVSEFELDFEITDEHHEKGGRNFLFGGVLPHACVEHFDVHNQ